MLQKIDEILQAANNSYFIEYDATNMIDAGSNAMNRGRSFAYIEEFVQGKFATGIYGQRSRMMKLQIYFCKYTELQTTALEREALRRQIIDEAIEPFMAAYDDSSYFEPIHEWEIFYTTPRFAENEVSVMLEFECRMTIC